MYPEALLQKTAQLVQQLNTASQSITVAESCTGGLLGGLITSVAGASDVFHQGFIIYSNEAKQVLLGVDEALLAEHGAVSESVARAMASGALAAADADIALSITGIAGPGGGSAEKPVGLVYIGCRVRNANANVKMGEVSRPSEHPAKGAHEDNINITKNIFTGDRQEIRLQSCEQAIQMALDALQYSAT